MAHGQQIDTATVKQAGDDLELFANQVTGRLNRIKGEVERLSGTYSGRGALAFSRAMVNWDATAENVRRAVLELSGKVRQGGVQHTRGDEETEQPFTQVAAGSAYPSLGGMA